MKEQTCCLTGHRELPRDTDELVRRLTDAICGRIEAGVRYFGVGGAVGFDTLAAEVLLNLRDTLYPQIRVIAVEPFDGFTSRWTDAQRARRQALLLELLQHLRLPVVCLLKELDNADLEPSEVVEVCVCTLRDLCFDLFPHSGRVCTQIAGKTVGHDQ